MMDTYFVSCTPMQIHTCLSIHVKKFNLKFLWTPGSVSPTGTGCSGYPGCHPAMPYKVRAAVIRAVRNCIKPQPNIRCVVWRISEYSLEIFALIFVEKFRSQTQAKSATFVSLDCKLLATQATVDPIIGQAHQ